MISIIYFGLAGTLGVIMSTIDYGCNTWQFWAVLSCFIGSYICGREWR